MVWGWFKHITFIVHFVSIVTSALPQIIRYQIPKLGDLWLGDPCSSIWRMIKSLNIITGILTLPVSMTKCLHLIQNKNGIYSHSHYEIVHTESAIRKLKTVIVQSMNYSEFFFLPSFFPFFIIFFSTIKCYL